MLSNLELSLYVFMLATFVGLEIIRKVSPLLHTPLMSLTNAISAISVVGAILITGAEGRGHQHRERFPDHRPDAQDVQAARGEEVDDALHLHRLGGVVHSFAEVDEFSGQRAARRVCGRNRDAAGDHRNIGGAARF
jgi:hypothetical protein